MKRIGTFLALTVVALLLLGQGAPNNGSYMTPNGGTGGGSGGVTQHGSVTSGDCAQWFASGSIEDSGSACGSGGGNTITLTAGTNIAAGTSVSINTSGQAVQTWGPAPNIAGVVTAIPAFTGGLYAAVVPLSPTIFIAWATDLTSSTKFVVLTKTGTSVVVGSVVTQIVPIAKIVPLTATEFIFIDINGVAYDCTITGTGAGAIITIGTGYNNPSSIAIVEAQQLAAASFVEFLKDGTAVTGSVSGGVITFGTPVTIGSGTISNVVGQIEVLTSGLFVVVFSDSGNSNFLTGVACTVSGTTESCGSAAAISGAPAATVSFPGILTTSTFALGYSIPSGGNNAAYGVVGSVSGTTVTFGTPQVLSYGAAQPTVTPQIAGGSPNEMSMTVVSPTSIAFGAGNVLPQVVTVSGTSLTVPTLVPLSNIGYSSSIYPINTDVAATVTNGPNGSLSINSVVAVGSNLMVVDGVANVYEVSSAGVQSPLIEHVNLYNYGLTPADSTTVLGWFLDFGGNFQARVITYEPINNGPIGFAGSACTNGNPCTITVAGVATGFSGLAPGVTYYSNGDGTITLGNTGGIGTLAGVALTSSTILIQRGRTNYLLKRDLDPTSNDNSPAFMDQAA
jgi:hypothetical protein